MDELVLVDVVFVVVDSSLGSLVVEGMMIVVVLVVWMYVVVVLSGVLPRRAAARAARAPTVQVLATSR